MANLRQAFQREVEKENVAGTLGVSLQRFPLGVGPVWMLILLCRDAFNAVFNRE